MGGDAVIWKPKDGLTVLFEPSAYNQPDATRVNLCLSVTPAVVSSLQAFDDWCVTTLAAQSSRLLGSQLSVEEVRNRYQPTLRVHEASGSQSLRLCSWIPPWPSALSEQCVRPLGLEPPVSRERLT